MPGADRVLATGLDAKDHSALTGRALDTPAPIILCEGPEVTSGDATLVHYDMTGSCRENHQHAFWDPSIHSGPVLVEVTTVLVAAIGDPDWKMPHVPIEESARVLRPEVFSVSPVLVAVLATAASTGQGVRQAMDWLSSGQLDQVAAHLRSTGAFNPIFYEQLDRVLLGTPYDRQQATNAAWRALAPIEEVMRTTVVNQAAQRLDVGAWLKSGRTLAISLPSQPNVGYQQAVAAIVTASSAELGAKPDTTAPSINTTNTLRGGSPRQRHTPHCLWLDVSKPKLWEWNTTAFAPRALVIANRDSCFAEWASSKMPHDVLIGAHADRHALETAGRLTGRPLVAPEAGNVVLIRDGRPETVTGPSAP